MNEEDLLDKEFNKIVGQVLKSIRERKGYSLQQLANKLTKPISRQTLSKYENNLSNIRNGVFVDICKALGEQPPIIYEEISLKYMRFVDQTKDKKFKK